MSTGPKVKGHAARARVEAVARRPHEWAERQDPGSLPGVAVAACSAVIVWAASLAPALAERRELRKA